MFRSPRIKVTRYKKGRATILHVPVIPVPVSESSAGQSVEATSLPLTLHHIQPEQCMPVNTPTETLLSQSAYYKTKQKEIDSWIGLRTKLLDCFESTEGHPECVSCVVCGEDCTDTKYCRCLDCGSQYVACSDCALADHRYRPSHVVEQWQVSQFDNKGEYPECCLYLSFFLSFLSGREK